MVNGERIGGGGADMVSEHNNQPVGANNLPSRLALGQGEGRGGRGEFPYWASALVDVNATINPCGRGDKQTIYVLGHG